MGFKQVGKPVGSSSVDSATVEEFSTAIADKTHLANLITTLKSELASTNALLKIKEKDYHDAKEQLKQLKGENSDANQRVAILEKQCENYRLNVRYWLCFVKWFFSCWKWHIFYVFRLSNWKNTFKHIPTKSSNSRREKRFWNRWV